MTDNDRCSNKSCNRPIPPYPPGVTGRQRWYCSRNCQVAARNPGGQARITVPITMAVWHRLHEYAEQEAVTVTDLIADAVYDLFDTPPDDDG